MTDRKKQFYRSAKIIFLILFFSIILDFSITTFRIYLLKFYNPTTTAFIQQDLEKCKSENDACSFQMDWKPLKIISSSLQKAVLISEDDAFFEHEGIDTDAIQESIEINLKKKKIVRGGSTITQQLVKNLYLSSSKNPLRKIKEMLLALVMEKLLTKQRILEIYLNVIEWGNHVYGAEAASRFYFKKTASDLSVEECAYLAVIIPNPILYSKPGYSKRVLRRKSILLHRMNYRSFEELN